MLKGIHPALNADVLFVLRAMGHGDTLALVDTNFPADTIAKACVAKGLPRMDNLTLAQALQAILTVFPLEAAARMRVGEDPDDVPPVQAEALDAVRAAAPEVADMRPVERFRFYEEAKAGYAVIATGERRFYGCLILTKGVVPPDA